ncbi:MAG TPA: glutamyl-tRNA reductase [Chthoniobacteraceae bacterium]|nr:glutamyl-tRNA reductase [Chthoniobacteraceae bacterium]
MNVICLGLSHHTASVELREKFAVADADLADAAHELGAMEGIHESVIVSTCNRVELFAATDNSPLGFESLGRFLTRRANEHHYDPHIFHRHDSPQSVRHLFRVVSGLESMVLGETEILGQVKKAYAAAATNGKTARHLNKLFQRAFNVAKEVRTNTAITRGPVSVGSVAVDLAEKIFGRLAACKVMILGAGETSEMTARALQLRGVKSLFVSNRSHDRAMALAAEMGGEAIRFDEWEKPLAEMDIVIGSTASPHPVLTREKLAPVMNQRKNRPLFIIDLAVPRDVEASVNKLDGVYLYDIDSLQSIAAQSMEIRRKEMAVCEQMIERHVNDFIAWLTTERPDPTAAIPPVLAANRVQES